MFAEPVLAQAAAAVARFMELGNDYLKAVAGSPAAGSADAAADSAAAASFSDRVRDLSMSMLRLPWTGNDFEGQGAALIDALRELPALGLYRERQQQLQHMADTGRHVEQARCRLQTLLSDSLQQAATAYAAKLPALARGPEDWHGLYTAWIECAEAAYGDTVHGEPFCLALADYVNASAAWREQCAAQFERTLQSLDLPTRSELNSLTARLKELERLVSARTTTPAAKPAP